jgi:predicted RNA binding protein YcfA (HicA-like mRNA interferase family)
MKSLEAIKELRRLGFTERRGKGTHLIMTNGTEMIVLSHPTELSLGMAGKVRSLINRLSRVSKNN